MKRFALIVLILISFVPIKAQPFAFPSAEGFGKYTTGGREGKVYYVTSLADDNSAGTLRWALNQTSPKTILFKLSGTIMLQSKLSISKGQTTIAGQSAPGDGICIGGYPVTISADDIIIRYIRFRMGDELEGGEDGADALGARYYKNIIVDHCSMSWSTDECVSIYGNENTTLQWCIIAESLRLSGHTKGAHGYGGIWGGTNASFHHNLMAHHDSRTPRLGPSTKTQLNEYTDIRNNVYYNYSGNGCYGAEGMNVNIVNNFYKPGPASNSGSKRGRIIAIDKKINLPASDGFYPINNVWGKFFIEGNVVDASTSTGSDVTVCNNVTADNWNNGVYNQYDGKYGKVSDAEKDEMTMSSPFKFENSTTHTAELAYDKVIELAGASLVRDTHDLRIIDETINGTAAYKGLSSANSGSYPKWGIIDSQNDTKPADADASWSPWPTLNSTPAPRDTDLDGMPDEWEVANGLDPNDAEDGNKIVKSGYTCLEVYLNALVGETIELDFTISEKKVHDFVVAKDGTGDFTTINEAIEAAADNGERTTIFVKKGIYEEKVFIGDRWVSSNKVISLIGENVDSVIIIWDDYLGKEITYPGKNGTIVADGMTCPTMTVTSPDFYMENITVKNPYNAAQAVALYQTGDGQVLKNCKILGNQDTHRTKKGRRYFYFQTTIEGGVDFIYAGGTCYFYQCAIVSNRNGYITAPEDITYKRTLESGITIRYGFIFNDCDLLATEGVSNGSVYLGRPWGPECGSVFMNCRLGNHINSKGWEAWNGNEKSACFAEFNSMNQDSSALADVSNRVAWSIQLSKEDVNGFLLLSKVYSLVSTTKFDPVPKLIAPESPTAISVDGNMLSWTVKSAAEGYVVYANGEAIGFNRSNHYADTLSYDTPPVYTVRAVGPLGNLSLPNGQGESFTEESINEAINTAMDVPEENGIGQINYYEPVIRNGIVYFERPTNIKVFSLAGQLIITVNKTSDFNLERLKSGLYIVQASDDTNHNYRFKINGVH
ncbi:MAG: pectinesterase family protein [Prolixibacteraceae bacterium]